MDHFSKHCVQSIEMRLLGISNEELASISIGTTIGHRHYTPCIVLENEPKKSLFMHNNKTTQVT